MVGLPTGRNGRLLAVGLLIMALLVVWIGVVAPVVDWYSARAAQLSALNQRAAREAALIATLSTLKKDAAAATSQPTRAVLAGSTDAIAGASLQEQVQSMATNADAQLTSIETLPAEQVADYRRIGVRVEMNAQLPVVVALLKAVEEAQPSMLVDDIHLASTPVGPMATQLPLDASFTVYGFRVGTGKDATE
ncbi:MAG TPA: type II secretion system protein GspM [Acetobacteraceae bacterium]|nr:type II secretion system protein GspM [Acetobacteraceae bacterium]